MTTVGMLGLFYISSFIDKSDKLFKGQVSIGMVLEFLFWSTPEWLTYIIAIAVLLSGLVTVGLLTKNSELIVMRACGISLYRTALPMVVFAAAAGAVLVGIQENVLAAANRRADQLNHHIRTGTPQTFGLLNRKWIVGRERRDLSLSVLRPAPARAASRRGVRVRSAGPHAQDAAVRAEGHLHRGRAAGCGAAMGAEPGMGPGIRTRQPGALSRRSRIRRRASSPRSTS